ncbi:MAG: HAMP domain-containing sensor histidine kinase [Kiritimatiellia bacterium]|nr:HAMP domain-containing sensor histidine kinase [Kiritimatiellia bacterium]
MELILLSALLTSALAAGCVLVFLKDRHDRQAHLAATATVLQEGEALLQALCDLGVCCSTHPSPGEWRRFSTVVDSAFAVRKDVQSVSVSRNGITVFQRQAGGLHPPGGGDTEFPVRNKDPRVETEIAPGTLEINGKPQPVFVIARTQILDDGGRVVTEATFRREAVGAEERTARSLVSSLFWFSLVVVFLSFALCAAVGMFFVARDRRRQQRARREEHLAFSGVLANGILHDFRNPMSAVRLDAQMLGREMDRADGFRAERVRDLAERIARTMSRMDKVFQEFLFLAKPADEQPEPVRIEQVVRECADTLAPRLEQAAVRVAIRAPDKIPPASAFPFALRRALLNVLMNAIQFAPEGSEITAVIEARNRQIVLDVLDRGPGIPPAQREKVFEMFVSGRPGGTGLGLFLARTAVRRCGGDIQAFARGGGGADLRITLPAAPPSSPPPPDA